MDKVGLTILGVVLGLSFAAATLALLEWLI